MEVDIVAKMVKSPHGMLVTPDSLLHDRPEADSVLILTTRFQPCQLKKMEVFRVA